MSWRDTLNREFQGALPGEEVTRRIIKYLTENEGFTANNTVFGSSTCSDEVNRGNTSLGAYFGANFAAGGLAGFPHTGKTGFGAFAHHAPDEEGVQHTLEIYGPHIGISESGELGKVHRPGMKGETTACGSIIAAYRALETAWGEDRVHIPDIDPHDFQQWTMSVALARYAPRIMNASHGIKEATHVVYEAAKAEVDYILERNRTSCHGLVALVGGIQINTPSGTDDYFLPMRFGIYNMETGEEKNLLHVLQE